MKRLLLSLALLCVMVIPSPAQQYQTLGWQVQKDPPAQWIYDKFIQVQNRFEGPQAPQNQVGAPVVVQPTPQNTQVVTAPAAEKVNELPSWGTVLGGVITALSAWFIPQLVTILRNWAVASAGPAGALVNGLLGDRLEEMVKNGMFKAAGEVSKSLDGKIPISEKSVFQQKVADYVSEHGVELIQKLGGVIGTGTFFDAIKARTEKNLIDPKFPIQIDPDSVQHQDHPFDLKQVFGDMLDAKFGINPPGTTKAQGFTPSS